MLSAGKVGTAPGTSTIRYWPYEDVSLKNSGLGIIDPHDWWHTGRPYGLPGTVAINLKTMELAGLNETHATLPGGVNPWAADEKSNWMPLILGVAAVGMIYLLTRGAS